MFFSYNFLFISFLNTYDSTLNTSDNAVTKDTWISYLNNVDHLYLNPNANSIPAAPPPHITTFGIQLLCSNDCSFEVILSSKWLMGLVVKECWVIPGYVLLPMV
jgi:hypothetical protein